MKPLVLFDVDGTLLLTGGAGMRAMQRVAARLFGQGFRWDGIEVSGHLDPLIFAEAAERNGLRGDPEQHRSFRDAYLGALRAELETSRDHIRIMPGIRETLDVLRSRSDVVLGLLTGNYSDAIPLKLGAIRVDPGWFSVTAYGDEADSRAGLVEVARRKYEATIGPIDNTRIVIVGDTPRDVECGKAHGCVTFAVATGRFEMQQLQDAGADHVVGDLGDPRPLLDLIDRFGEGRLSLALDPEVMSQAQK